MQFLRQNVKMEKPHQESIHFRYYAQIMHNYDTSICIGPVSINHGKTEHKPGSCSGKNDAGGLSPKMSSI
jgi:hypothetical protein